MSRVEPQLREYFDAGVERISVTWLIRRPAKEDTQDQQDQGKVMVMETIEDTDSDVGTRTTPLPGTPMTRMRSKDW